MLVLAPEMPVAGEDTMPETFLPITGACKACGNPSDGSDPDCQACGAPLADYVGNVDADDEANEGSDHVGHFSQLGGTWWCDTCNSPYCDLA
jgi:hypothetical protein